MSTPPRRCGVLTMLVNGGVARRSMLDGQILAYVLYEDEAVRRELTQG